MANNKYTPKPSVSKFNEDEHAGKVLGWFNDNLDKKRMEIVDQLNQSTFPSVIPSMKGGGNKKANGGK